MTVENQNTSDMEAAVTTETNRIVLATCERHGISRDQLSYAQLADARHSAEENVAREAARRANPMFAENELLRQKLESAEAQLFASKSARTSAASIASANTQPAVSVETARAKLGEYQWNHVMTPNTRLQAIGVQPSEVTPAVRSEIEEVFGPKSTSARASEMHRADPLRYRRLREIGRCLRMI